MKFGYLVLVFMTNGLKVIIVLWDVATLMPTLQHLLITLNVPIKVVMPKLEGLKPQFISFQTILIVTYLSFVVT